MRLPSSPTRSPPPRRPSILWNVVREHLDEAAFFWRIRQRSLCAPDHELADLADGDERRLLAHVEGLRLAGPRVVERLLVPTLEVGEGPERAVAAYTLLILDVARWGPRILECLRETPPEERGCLLQALALGPVEGIDPLLRDALPGMEPGLQAAVLDVLRVRQADVEPVLARLSLAESPEVLAAAIRATRQAPERVVAPLVSRGLEAADEVCLDAALEVGLMRGHFATVERCRNALSTGQAGRTALTFLAVGGERRGAARLLSLLEQPALRTEVLWALGLNGRSEALDAVLRLVLSEGDPLAAESFRLITGIPLETYRAPPEEDEDVGEPSAPGAGVSFLPGPAVPVERVSADAVGRWWHEARSRFPRGGRYVWGRSWTPEATLQALLAAPVTRRPALAWELAIRSGGACCVETGTWAWVQAQQIRTARGFRMDLAHRAFEAVLG